MMKYIFPINKKERLFDFYLMTMFRETINPKINFLLNETKEILLKNQKQAFLNDLFYTISAEFRHIKSVPFEGKEIGHLFRCAKFLTDEQKRFLSIYYKLKDAPYDRFYRRQFTCKSGWAIQSNKIYFEETSDDYKDALRKTIKALKESKFTPEEFVILAQQCFSVLAWGGSYGGEKWAKICNGWLKLEEAKADKEIIAYIDHIYDLEHNNNTVFDKMNSYEQYYSDQGYYHGGHYWIKASLNLKAKVVHPYELMDSASYSMQRIAKKILYANYHITEQKYCYILDKARGYTMKTRRLKLKKDLLEGEKLCLSL